MRGSTIKPRSARVAGMLFLIIVLTTCVSASANGVGVTEQQAVALSDAEVKRLGKDLSKLERDVDKTWERFLRGDPKLLGKYPEAAEKLGGRSYWAVTYIPSDPLVRGGGYTIFVDKQTGQVLAVIRYE